MSDNVPSNQTNQEVRQNLESNAPKTTDLDATIIQADQGHNSQDEPCEKDRFQHSTVQDQMKQVERSISKMSEKTIDKEDSVTVKYFPLNTNNTELEKEVRAKSLHRQNVNEVS